MKKSGFTIVELLIVVVVIAILAAITIVAYNGIQDRAKESAIKSDVANAKKAMEVFKVTNSRYPTSSGEAALKASANVTASYTPISGGAGYCAQFTNGSLSYFVSNVSDQKPGVCATVTNLAVNPSVEVNSSGWSSRWYGSGGSGTATPQSPSAALCGSVGYRKTWTVSGSGFQDLGVVYSHAGPTAGQSYDFVISSRSSFATTYRLWVEWRDSSNNQIDRTASVITQAPNANTWYTMKTSGVTPAGATNAVVIASPYPGGSADPGWGATIPVGSTVDADCVMVSNSIPNTDYKPDYTDGSMTNWAWTGTPHTSTSTGVGY